MKKLSAIAALGALGAFHFPTPLWLLAHAGAAYLLAREKSVPRALLGGAVWGLALALGFFLSARAWGWSAVFGLSLLGPAFIGIPLALLSQLSSRFGRGVVVVTVSFWCLLRVLTNLTHFPMIDAMVWVSPAVRWLGADIAGGILTGSAIAFGLGNGWRAFLPLLLLLCPVPEAPATGTVSVGVPQPNLSDDDFRAWLSAPAQAAERRARYDALLSALNGVDLVVTTEGNDGRFAWEIDRAEWTARAERMHARILLSTYDIGADTRERNTILDIASDGALQGEHVKTVLAPFGEHALGEGTSEAPLGELDARICMESMFRANPQARLVVVTTSDGSFGRGALTWAHLAATRVRAREAGRDVVWASNAGPSGIITRDGEFVAGVPFGTSGAMRMTAHLYDDTPPNARYRWLWCALLSCALAIGLWRPFGGIGFWRPFGATRRRVRGEVWLPPTAVSTLAVVLLLWPNDGVRTRQPAAMPFVGSHAALAYFASNYGLSTLPKEIPDGADASLDTAAAWLKSCGMHTRRVPIGALSTPGFALVNGTPRVIVGTTWLAGDALVPAR